MNDDRDRDEIWQQCTAVVTRLESETASSIETDLFQRFAEDFVDSVAPVWSVEILDRCGAEEQLLAATDGSFETVEICRHESPITETSTLVLRVGWNGRNEGVRPAIEETVGAVGGLLVAAIARSRLQAAQDQLSELHAIAASLSSASEPSEILHRAAVEIATTIKADRVSLLQSVGDHYRFIASSVRPDVDLRAERVRSTCDIASTIDQALASGSESVVIHRDAMDGALARFADEGSIASIAVMRFEGESILAIGESFETLERNATEWEPAHRMLIRIALADAARRQPSSTVDKITGIIRGRGMKARLAIAALLVAFAMLFPMTIRVGADGRVVPRKQHIVYAPVSGQLERIRCRGGDRVDAGQVLCELSSHPLLLQVTRLEGEILTLEEKLEIASTRRVDPSANDIESDRSVLETRRRELEKQMKVLRDRQSELIVRSPIAGVVSLVIDDDSDATTVPRPVEVGEAMIRVVAPDEGYRVELQIRDSELGYVLDAMDREGDQPVRCRFRVRSEPERRHEGIVRRIDQSAELDRYGRIVVPATVRPIDSHQIFVADASVVAWIDCNRAAAGFVLCRKVIEQLRLWGWL